MIFLIAYKIEHRAFREVFHWNVESTMLNKAILNASYIFVFKLSIFVDLLAHTLDYVFRD